MCYEAPGIKNRAGDIAEFIGRLDALCDFARDLAAGIVNVPAEVMEEARCGYEDLVLNAALVRARPALRRWAAEEIQAAERLNRRRTPRLDRRASLVLRTELHKRDALLKHGLPALRRRVVRPSRNPS